MTDNATQGIERSPRRLLVTGGAGFIGSNFVHHWCSSYPGDRVVVLDALTYAGNRQTLATLEGGENFRFVQGDICDRTLVDTLLKEENINTVAHFAAESHVDRSIIGAAAFVQTNVVGTFTLLEAFRKHFEAIDEFSLKAQCASSTFLPTKFTAVSARRPSIHRNNRLLAQQSLLSLQSWQRPPRPRLFPYLRRPNNYHQLFKQLRPSITSQKSSFH